MRLILTYVLKETHTVKHIWFIARRVQLLRRNCFTHTVVYRPCMATLPVMEKIEKKKTDVNI